MQEFDIAEFLEQEDERERQQRVASKKSRVWSPKSNAHEAEDDANVLDDPPDVSEGASGINTDIDALGGDREAHAVLDRLRSEHDADENDCLSPRARRIAEIRARIEQQRQKQGKSRFKVKQPDHAKTATEEQSELLKYVAVGILVSVSSLAFMYTVYSVQRTPTTRMVEGLD